MRKYLIIVSAFIILSGDISAQLPLAANGKLVEAKGRKIYVEELGAGMPLLLLHGFGRSAEEWKSMIPELAKTNRVIAIDLPGHARSEVMDTTQKYFHKQAAEIILSFLDTLKIDSLNVMGFSAGGILALHMAVMQPDRLKKIIVMGAQVKFSEATRNFIKSLGSPFNFVMDQVELTQIHGKLKGEQVARQFWHFQDLKGDPAFTPEMLGRIKAKALIIHGDDDPAAPIDNAWIMFKNIKGAHLWIIPNGEHIGIFSAENESEIIRRVGDFLIIN